MTGPGSSRLFPVLLGTSLVAHLALPFVAAGRRAPELALEHRRPRTPMAVRLLPPPPPEPLSPSVVERLLSATAAERTVESVEVAPTEFRPPEREAPVFEHRVPDEVVPSAGPPRLPPPPDLAVERPDEPPPRDAEPPPVRAETPRVEVALEWPSDATDLAAAVLEHAEPAGGRNPIPEYPGRARARRLEGSCVLLVEVTPEGRVASVRLESGTGHAILDDAAVVAVRRWHFRPARGVAGPVADTVRIPITFRLQD